MRTVFTHDSPLYVGLAGPLHGLANQEVLVFLSKVSKKPFPCLIDLNTCFYSTAIYVNVNFVLRSLRTLALAPPTTRSRNTFGDYLSLARLFQATATPFSARQIPATHANGSSPSSIYPTILCSNWLGSCTTLCHRSYSRPARSRTPGQMWMRTRVSCCNTTE